METKLNKKGWVYDTLRRQIINVELQPGLPINEADFAARLGVSKTPVREALRQLERDGFVENVPSRGSTISHITSQEISDVFQIREIIESGAAKRAAHLQGNDLFRKMREDNQRYLERVNTSEEYVHEWGSWEDMHLVIVSSLGNHLLVNVYGGLIDRILRIRNYFGKRLTRRRILDVVAEHTAILDAIIDGDAERAEQSMQRHLKNASVFLIGLSGVHRDYDPASSAVSASHP